MDPNAVSQLTQAATPNIGDPKDVGTQDSNLSTKEASDIICFLVPVSEATREEVARLATEPSCSQHIVGKVDADTVDLDYNYEDGLGRSVSIPDYLNDHAIALRPSAPVKDPLQGFWFGRNANRCDLYFANDPLLRLSNVHFRIFINEYDVLMLQDQSTNGTVVDGLLLKRQAMSRLENGSKITILLSPRSDDISFLVLVPRHEGEHEKAYLNNLRAYRDRLAVSSCGEEGLMSAGSAKHVSRPISSKVRASAAQNQAQSKVKLHRQTTWMHVETFLEEWKGSDRYRRIGEIGSGPFTAVYKVESKFDGKLFVAKELDQHRFMKNRIVVQELYDEINIMQKVHHPNIVRYVEDIDWNSPNPVFIMEYVPGGGLDSFVARHGPLPEADVKAVARQVLDALGFLHRNLIVHGDVKPSRVLIQSQQPFTVKLADSSLSKLTDNGQARFQTSTSTLLYCAPEAYPEYDEFRRRNPRIRTHRDVQAVMRQFRPRYDHAIDIWSLGATLFYALTGNPPFPVRASRSRSTPLDLMMDSPLDTSPLHRMKCSGDCIHFLSQMLQRRPEVRATIDSLQVHPWLSGSRPTERSDGSMLPGEISNVGLQPWPSPLKYEPGYSVIAQVIEPEAPISDSGYGTSSNWTHQTSPANKSTAPDQGELECQLTDPESDDDATVYSDTSSLSGLRTESYNSKFAEDLVERLDLDPLNEKVLDSLVGSLPDLLKALASKIGYQASSQMHCNVRVFLHKHRGSIAKSFRDSYFQTREALHVESEVAPKEPPATEVMDRWLSDLVVREYEDQVHDVAADEQADASDDDFEDDSRIPGLEDYRKLISSDPGYDWLLNCLRRETILARPVMDRMQAIQNTILQAIPKSRYVSRKTSSTGCTVTYTVEWDPFAFLAVQDYEDPDHEAVAKAITLTGLWRDAQALSCQEYLTQTWPSSGPLLMQLIKNLVSNRDAGANFECQTLNGTKLSASLDQSCLVVKASGVPDFVAEIGGQLAWLGAALRPSHSESSPGLVCCVPLVDRINHIAYDKGHDYLTCSLKFSLREPEEAFQHVKGQCWYALFRRPVVVEGFPIPRRPEGDTGLEVSLSMMAALIDARSVDIFDSKVFIKGFSAMLMPTTRLDNTVVWHLVHNPTPDDRISYLDCPTEHEDVQLAELGSARHIVGWCPEADCNIVWVLRYVDDPEPGTRAANYSVRKSGLPRTYSGCALEKLEIQGGQFIMGTASFSIGNREKPVHISRSGYMNKMQWISSKYVMFWDEAEKRGWLVNGARALLHLLRASLEHSKGKFKSAFLLDPRNLADIGCTTGSESALDALMDQKNRTLPLYIDKSEVYDEETRTNIAGASTVQVVTKRHTRYYRLEDRVEHIYNMMEKLIDHQADIERRSGLQVNPRPRRQLEGWDFRDLVTDGDPFFPKVSTLQTIGKGWVDLTRAIHAVCLFGRGFGDMIQPRPTLATGCSRWSRLPVERYYLAACVSDIKEIIDNDGDATLNPMRICDSVLWHMKQTTFQACPCTKDAKSKHHDPVQVLFPKAFTSLLKLKPQVGLEDRGAVIFGHNMNLHWHWRDHGGPVKGDPPLDEPAAVPASDSGVGLTSVGPSSTSGAAGGRSSSARSSRSDTPPSSQPSAAVSPSDKAHRPTSDSSAIPDGRKRAGSKRLLLELGSPISSIGKRMKSKK